MADNADAYTYTATGLSGKIVVAGSSSVTPVMEKLAEAYEAFNPEVSIEVNQSDSTAGVQMAAEGTCDIGMAPRDLKNSESAVTAAAIAQIGLPDFLLGTTWRHGAWPGHRQACDHLSRGRDIRGGSRRRGRLLRSLVSHGLAVLFAAYSSILPR